MRRPLSSFDAGYLLSLRDRTQRDADGVFFVEGLRFAHAALDSGAEVLGVALCQELARPHGLRTVLERLAGVPRIWLSRREFERLEFGPEPQGIALVLTQRRLSLPSIEPRGTWLGIESVQSAGNLGTILRSMSASGASGLMLFSRSGVYEDPFDPAVVRSSMGALLGVPLVYTSYRELDRWGDRSELRVLGADASGRLEYQAVRFRRPVLLMIGHERHGLSPGQRSACDGLVRIPMARGVDSLNVAMAATVLLFESFGQRRRKA